MSHCDLVWTYYCAVTPASPCVSGAPPLWVTCNNCSTAQATSAALKFGVDGRCSGCLQDNPIISVDGGSCTIKAGTSLPTPIGGIGIGIGIKYDCKKLSDLLDQAYPCKLSVPARATPVGLGLSSFSENASFRLTCSRSVFATVTIELKPTDDIGSIGITIGG